MTEQIIDATIPTVVGKRFGGHMLRIEFRSAGPARERASPSSTFMEQAAGRESACRGRGMDIDSPIATLTICRRNCGSGAATTRWATTSSRPARRG